MNSIQLTPEVVALYKGFITEPHNHGLEIDTITECLIYNDAVTGKHILAEEYMAHIQRPIPKVILYIIMDQIFGPCTKRDERGNLGYNLKFEVPVKAPRDFQTRVDSWLINCLGEEKARDKKRRNHMFIEEALELVQATGFTKEDVLKVVDYVYGREAGQPGQEVGGAMVTLAALCLANDINMHTAADEELARVWRNMENIRERDAKKPVI